MLQARSVTDWREAYRAFEFMESRVPALDALSIFIPDGAKPPPDVEEVLRNRPSRWRPVPGGHQVTMLHEGEPYDPRRFTLEPGAWNHDHCSNCRSDIPAMTLCWVTRTGLYVVLCGTCKARLDES